VRRTSNTFWPSLRTPSATSSEIVAAEAVQRPTMRFVPLKGDEQLDLQALHRVRSRLVGERTAVINQIRGFLLEHGITVRQGPAGLRQALPSSKRRSTDDLP
jgi:transposase